MSVWDDEMMTDREECVRKSCYVDLNKSQQGQKYDETRAK
jgi:hypothetical protein